MRIIGRLYGLGLIATVAYILIAAPFAWQHPAVAGTITPYQSPNEEQWYATLKQPDSPLMNCCGWGDAYYADKTDECKPSDGPICAVVAIITDTRPDSRTYVRDDGTKIEINRPHIDVGTRIPIPPHKMRKRPVENPTDHNVVFVDMGEYEIAEPSPIVWCWEPVGGF